VIKLSRVNALCAGIALAMAGSAFAAAPDSDRVWVKFSPGAKGNVENALRAAGGRIHHTFDDLGAFAVSVPAQALNGLRNNPNIEYIEQDVARYPMAQTVPYGIPMVQAPDAWAAGGDGTGILVCVIDSGVNSQHEDLGANILGGYPTGWNSDLCGHGTHVAGSVGALNNSTGVVGVAPNTSFYMVQVFSGTSCGWSYSSTLIDAANRCAQQGTSRGKRVVINMSLGGGQASTTESNGFQSLYDTGNVLSIAAAGNSGNTTKSYPASYNSVMSVAAIDSNKALASFSQRNDQVEIAAPGVDILSTMPGTEASVVVSGQGYMVSPMDGTPQLSRSGALVNGARCTGTNGAWSGKVVLCERGDIAFADKVLNVQNSGGVAAIVYNNVAGSFGGTLGSTSTSIPSVSMAQDDGQFLVASRIGQSASVSTIVQNPANGYGLMSGTSMASPHVAGAAAAIWSSKPTATNADIRNAMTSTAEDLGSAGRDNSFGWGLVRTASAIAALNGGGNPPPPPADGVSSVGSVGISFTSKGKNFQARATVSAQGDGAPLAGASVSGCFSGAVNGCGTGTTGSNGQIIFTSGSFKSRSNVEFCVSAISKDGYTFQAGANDCGNATP
jgi:serine protease